MPKTISGLIFIASLLTAGGAFGAKIEFGPGNPASGSTNATDPDNNPTFPVRNIDSFFDFSFNQLIQDENGNNISELFRHVEIWGTGTDQVDFFSFQATAGHKLILDMDCAEDATLTECPTGLPGNMDGVLELIDPDGVVFTDDDYKGLDDSELADGLDLGTPDVPFDPYASILLGKTGLWLVSVGDFFFTGDTPAIQSDQSYILNVSISPVPVSPVPVPATIWLFGTVLIGLVGMSRRTSVKS